MQNLKPNDDTLKIPDSFFEKLCDVHGDNERENLIGEHFKHSTLGAIYFENFIFNMADQVVENYTGGMWDFASTKKNKGLFMYLEDDVIYSMRGIANNNYTAVDGRIVGLLTTMFAYSHGSFHFENNESLCNIYADSYHALQGDFFKAVDDFDADASVSVSDKEMMRRISSFCSAYID